MTRPFTTLLLVAGCLMLVGCSAPKTESGKQQVEILAPSALIQRQRDLIARKTALPADAAHDAEAEAIAREVHALTVQIQEKP